MKKLSGSLPGSRYSKWILVLAVLATIWVFRGELFRSMVTYHELNQRPLVELSQPACNGLPPLPEDVSAPLEIMLFAQEITSERLVFRQHAITIDPNQMKEGCATHCVGYAALCASVTGYYLSMSGSSHVRVCHVVCTLSFLGMDLHSFFSDPFFQDHDAVLLTDDSGTVILMVDPVLFDYTGIRWVRIN